MPTGDPLELPPWRGLLLVLLAYCAARIAAGGRARGTAHHDGANIWRRAATAAKCAATVLGGVAGLLLQLHEAGLV